MLFLCTGEFLTIRRSHTHEKYKQIFLYLLILTAITVLTVTSAYAVEIQWFGQSAFKITTPGGKVILIEPFITQNPKTPEALKDLSKLKQVDLVLVTHGPGPCGICHSNIFKIEKSGAHALWNVRAA